jgi:hypothetical protein
VSHSIRSTSRFLLHTIWLFLSKPYFLAVPPCLLTSRIPSHAPCRSTPPFPSQADFVDKQFTKEEVAEKVLEQYDEAGGRGKRRSCPDRHNSFVQNRVHPLLFFLSLAATDKSFRGKRPRHEDNKGRACGAWHPAPHPKRHTSPAMCHVPRSPLSLFRPSRDQKHKDRRVVGSDRRYCNS